MLPVSSIIRAKNTVMRARDVRSDDETMGS
jgi:hypothetical protein